MRERGPGGAGGQALLRRIASTTALVAGAGYLIWRMVATMGSGWLLLAVPMLLLELWGFVLFAGLVFRAWPRPATTPVLADPDLGDPAPDESATENGARADDPVHVVVTAGVAKPEALERTLIALARFDLPKTVTVVEGRHRDEIVAVCERFNVAYRSDGGRTGPDSLLTVIEDEPPTGLVLWLDGGEIPMSGLFDAGLAAMADPDVAIVQTARQLQNADSLVNLRRGGDPETIEDSVVGPSLSSIGLAPWVGGGSFIRKEALQATDCWPIDDPAALHRATIQLHRLGWRTVHTADQLIGVQAPATLDEYLGYRRRKALAAYRFLLSTHSPMLLRGVGLRSRLAHAAEAISHTAGFRQMGIVALVVAVLLSGRLPIEGSATHIASWWLPAWLLINDARRRIVKGVLRRGDTTRNAWRGLEAELSALGAILPSLPAIGRNTNSSKTYQHRSSLASMRGLVLCVLGLNVALLVRALTLAFEGLLPPFSITARVIVFGFAVLTLWPVLDVLQLTARRRQRRKSHRVAVNCPVLVNGQEGRSLDLTTEGIGVLGVDAIVGQVCTVNMTLPTGRRGSANRITGSRPG